MPFLLLLLLPRLSLWLPVSCCLAFLLLTVALARSPGRVNSHNGSTNCKERARMGVRNRFLSGSTTFLTILIRLMDFFVEKGTCSLSGGFPASVHGFASFSTLFHSHSQGPQFFHRAPCLNAANPTMTKAALRYRKTQ